MLGIAKVIIREKEPIQESFTPWYRTLITGGTEMSISGLQRCLFSWLQFPDGGIGRIGLRSFDGTTPTLAPVTCGVELNQVFLDRFNTICDGEGDAENGLPSSCSTACAAMWLPFAQSCDSYLQQVHPELAPFTQLCEATTAIDNGH